MIWLQLSTCTCREPCNNYNKHLTASTASSQHNMPRRRMLPSAALGALPSTSVEDPLSSKRMDSAAPEAMTTSSWTSPGEATTEHDSNTILDNLSPSLHAASKNFRCNQHLPWHPTSIPPGLVQPTCPMKYFDYKGQ